MRALVSGHALRFAVRIISDIVKGSSAKYNEYESYTPRKCRVGRAHDVETLGQVAEEMAEFAKDRDWLQYHTPR